MGRFEQSPTSEKPAALLFGLLWHLGGVQRQAGHRLALPARPEVAEAEASRRIVRSEDDGLAAELATELPAKLEG